MSRRQNFICETPGAPADPLGHWWWMNMRPPITIRRVRLTDSSVRSHARDTAARWPYGWRVLCRACPPAPPHPTYVTTPDGREWMWGTWRGALAFAIDHLRRDRHPS